jgi:hypothetical protein
LEILGRPLKKTSATICIGMLSAVDGFVQTKGRGKNRRVADYF